MSKEFWGLIVKAGDKKVYDLEEGRVLSIGQAALIHGKDNESTKLFVEVVDVDFDEEEKPTEGVKKFLLCILSSGRVDQYSLSANFFNGQQLTFSVEGSGEVHLTGLLDDVSSPYDEEDDLDESFSSLTDDQIQEYLKSKAAHLGEDEEDEEDEEEEEDEEDAMEEEKPAPKKGGNKPNQQQQQGQKGGNKATTPQKQEGGNKPQQNQQKGGQPQQNQQKGGQQNQQNKNQNQGQKQNPNQQNKNQNQGQQQKGGQQNQQNQNKKRKADNQGGNQNKQQKTN